MQQSTGHFNLNVEGLAGMKEIKTNEGKQKRRSGEDITELVTDQWGTSGDIGGGLYLTLEIDNRWNRRRTLQVVADNEALVNSLLGVAEVDTDHRQVVADILDIIAGTMVEHNWGPRSFDGEPIEWRKREYNQEADFLANYAMDTDSDFNYVNGQLLEGGVEKICNIQGWCDGGSRRRQNKSAYGWLLKVWLEDDGPFILAAGAKYYDRAATSSFEIEAQGMLAVWNALRTIVAGNMQQLELGIISNSNLSRKRRNNLLDGMLLRKSSWSLV